MRYALLVALTAACAPSAAPPSRAEVERLQSQGDYCRASDAAKARAQAKPSSPAEWVHYADGAAYCGRREEALAALERAAGLRVNSVDDLAAYLYMHLGEPQLSLRASDRFLSRFEGDAWHWLRRAQAAQALGDEAALADALRRASEQAARPGCEDVLKGLRWNRAGYIAARLDARLREPARLAARRAAGCAEAGADEEGRRAARELSSLLDGR